MYIFEFEKGISLLLYKIIYYKLINLIYSDRIIELY